MRVRLLLLSFLLSAIHASSQNPATVFNIPNRNIVLPCGVSCTQITATVPHIKQANSYIVQNMPYLPFAYTTPGGTEVTPIYSDDTWSPVIPISFPFCFYGITYPSLLMGSNANITFDIGRASTGSGYVISPTTGAIPNAAYAPATIFGPYHDINPAPSSNPPPTNRKVEYRVEGTAPTRRFIASYNDVTYFGGNCSNFKATHMMVLYESTGVIEVYIKDKPVCTDWNSGLTILGVQDHTQTVATAAPGKNATVWGSTGMNEAYRFTPFGGAPTFKRAELVVNGVVVATADTSSNFSNLNLNFNTVCPVSDSTAYVMRVVYQTCNNAATEVTFTDTVRVKKTTPTIALDSVNATCAQGGSISVSSTGGIGSIQYSLNGGTFQNSNVFNNLPAGPYVVTLRDSLNCTLNKAISVNLINNLTVTTRPDTSICVGGSFVANTTSNGTGVTYSWSPSQGLSSPTAQSPTITAGTQSWNYVVLATQGPCTARDTLSVNVFQVPQPNAGPDQTIIRGDIIQLQGQAGPGTYSWTPASGLTPSATVLNPTLANLQQTTTFTLNYTTAQGCIASDQVVITVLDCIDPMEAFSPNGDGMNDLWLVTNPQCLRQAKVQVFNRYGALVYESRDYRNNWNGTYNGKPVADGTYYYVISYVLINGKTEYEKGNVTILR